MPGGYDDCINGVTAEGRWARSCIHGPGPGGSHSTAATVISHPHVSEADSVARLDFVTYYSPRRPLTVARPPPSIDRI